MLTPRSDDKQYEDIKKLQARNPGVDVMKAVTDSTINGTPVSESIKMQKEQMDKESIEKKTKVEAK